MTGKVEGDAAVGSSKRRSNRMQRSAVSHKSMEKYEHTAVVAAEFLVMKDSCCHQPSALSCTASSPASFVRVSLLYFSFPFLSRWSSRRIRFGTL